LSRVPCSNKITKKVECQLQPKGAFSALSVFLMHLRLLIYFAIFIFQADTLPARAQNSVLDVNVVRDSFLRDGLMHTNSAIFFVHGLFGTEDTWNYRRHLRVVFFAHSLGGNLVRNHVVELKSRFGHNALNRIRLLQSLPCPDSDSTLRGVHGIDSTYMKKAALYARVSGDLQAKGRHN